MKLRRSKRHQELLRRDYKISKDLLNTIKKIAGESVRLLYWYLPGVNKLLRSRIMALKEGLKSGS